MLAPMLDWRTLLWCHTQVPVRNWPVLWYWLARLADTYTLCEMEGRRFVRWHLMRDGRIRVDYWDESDEERAARVAPDPRIRPEPWLRRLPWREQAGAVACAGLRGQMESRAPENGMPMDCRRTPGGLFPAPLHPP